MSLRDDVFENCRNAVENGYPINTWTAQQIIDDLLLCAADMEDRTEVELLPHVQSWLQSQGGIVCPSSSTSTSTSSAAT